MIFPLLLMVQAAPSCGVPDAALPPSFSGWTRPAGSLAPGKAIVLTSIDPATVRLADMATPSRPGRIALTKFSVRRAGTYGVALDQRAWIDVFPAKGPQPLASIGHGHGPACSTIRKIVRFKLAPGDYRVLVSGIAADRVKLSLVMDDRAAPLSGTDQ